MSSQGSRQKSETGPIARRREERQRTKTKALGHHRRAPLPQHKSTTGSHRQHTDDTFNCNHWCIFVVVGLVSVDFNKKEKENKVVNGTVDKEEIELVETQDKHKNLIICYGCC